MVRWACHWPSSRCRCTCSCPTTTPAAFGVPLATLGALLLGARLLDAVADPLIGRACDRWLGTSPRAALAARGAGRLRAGGGLLGAVLSAAVQGQVALLLWWCRGVLAVTYLSYSVLSVLHQAWGARLGGDEGQRSRIVSWREGLALVGVLVASVLPRWPAWAWPARCSRWRWHWAGRAWWRAPRPPVATAPARARDDGAPLHTPAFRRLLAVYLVNGIASAVPATLVLFFIRDRLQAAAWEPLFLASYFAAGALSMPLWVRLVARIGLARTWLAGMAAGHRELRLGRALGAGDVPGFTAVCWPAAWRWAPTWPCPARCWPAWCSAPATAAGWKALLRLVELRHQAQPGAGRRGWRCRCCSGWATPRAATPQALQALTWPTACCPAC
jgi:GPH family glycoside/pentoside/hexuronide:cation symporter